MCSLLLFVSKPIEAVVIALEVAMYELALDFLFFYDHKHCKQVSSKSGSENEMGL